RHGLPGGAARRFGGAVDPAIEAVAAEAAAELLVRYGGGEIVGRSDVIGNPLPQADVARPLGEPERLTGRSYEPAVITRRLEQVGCLVGGSGTESLLVSPPSWRPDLTRPAGLGGGGGPAGGVAAH